MKQQRTGGGSFAPRTDLACEAGRPGAESRSRTVTVGSAPVTVTRSRERDGGRFVTVSCGSLTGREEDIEALACLLAGEITELATLMLGRAPRAMHAVTCTATTHNAAGTVTARAR